MDCQKRPTSNIPRLSRLPVRSSTTSIQRPEQSTQEQPRIKAPELNDINVSRSRPKAGLSAATRQPNSRVNGYAKPPLNNVSARAKVLASSVTTVEEHGEEDTGKDEQQAVEKEPTRVAGQKPRPSLSDRAMETLSQIPPSPSPRRRQSGFFPTNSPAIRPPSSLGRSRPVTSTGFYPPLPTSRPTLPSKRPAVTRPGQMDASTPDKPVFGAGTIRAKQNPPMFSEESPLRNIRHIARDPKASNSFKSSMKKSSKDESTKVKGSKTTGPTPGAASPKSGLKSSAALRETIANAKAARRAASKYEADDLVKPAHHTFAFPEIGDEDGIHINLLQKRINSARNDGRLNISGMCLKKFPDEVLKMYDPDAMTDGATWYECVGLTRLDASNNEMEDLDWDSLDESAEDGKDQPPESIFGGLHSLNLQNNQLHILPSTFRNLNDLTVLNLSRNRLNQSMSDLANIVSNIPSLRELYLAENGLSSSPISPAQSSNLEILDLHGNALTSISDLSDRKMLRKLDISSNRISQLPCLDLPNLVMLNISINQIQIDEIMVNLEAPKLSELDISACRIDCLPNLRSKYPALVSLIAYDNRISTIDVESVRALEVLDLRRNDIRNLPPELSLLGLKKFLVGGNPMRAPRREILEGTTERLMEWLRARLPTSILDEETL
ncbi:MAG: hypothetical protein L6R41_007712 [Letrouitia leprolyta]|nr:MAG: hypothetical protein L6R41_007712 [Letrouitia leprolyta]